MPARILLISSALARSTRRSSPIDPDDDGLLAAGDHFLDALVEIGLGLPEQARIGVVDVLDRVQRRVVVLRRVGAHPVLAEVDPGHLLAEERLADVGPEVADPGDLAKLLADGRCGPPHLRGGRARLAHPVDEEVSFLEGREQRLPEQRNQREADDGDQREPGVRPARPDEDSRQQRGVAALQDPRRRATCRRSIVRPPQQQQRQGRGEGHGDDAATPRSPACTTAPAAGRRRPSDPAARRPARPRRR